MSLYIPIWALVALVLVLPAVVGWLVDRNDDSVYFHGMFGMFAFLLTAAVCWTGLAVWAWMTLGGSR